MNTITITQLDNQSITELYSVHGYTAKDIGFLVGLTESAILLKIKKIGLSPLNRAVKNNSVVVEYIGPRYDLKKRLTKERLEELTQRGVSDHSIGLEFGMTGEGVAYRRGKYGISASSTLKNPRALLESTDRYILNEDYLKLTVDEFSEKYKVSKTVWLPFLDSLGITRKNDERINSYPDLTEEQIQLIIGGLLGDGGITNDGRYYEFHSIKQETYLRKKCNLLKPFSTQVSAAIDGTGYSFRTTALPVFKKLRSMFYREGVSGKYIPLEYIEKNWGDSILAYWFFDDGYIDDVTGNITISNFCPDYELLQKLVAFLESVYSWGFHCGTAGDRIYRVAISKAYSKNFGDLLLRYATPDVYYKIPEISLTKERIKELPVSSLADIRPKFYRLSEDTYKATMEKVVFDYYRERGFPFSNLSLERQEYLLNKFIEVEVTCDKNVISYNTAGMPLCERFFPNLYKANRRGFPSPVELWNDDRFLMALVRNRLTYADRLTDASIRTGIKLTKACVSNFKPTIAKFLYSKYATNGKVLDYSCGFGSRMLAAMSLGLEYAGFEPSKDTYDNLQYFGTFIAQRTSGKFSILNSGSELMPYRKNYFSFAFSSPPYFDFEAYSKDPGQSIMRFPTKEAWLEGYWKQTMLNCYKALTESGFFGVCFSAKVARQQIDYTLQQAEGMGFYYTAGYKVPFKQVFSGHNSYEVVLIFSKSEKDKAPNPDDSFFEDTCQDTPVLFSEYKAKKREHNKYSIEDAKNLFKELSRKMGTSRETYNDPKLLGVPSYVLEHHYGTWNKFVVACGIEPGYVAKSPADRVREYFSACKDFGEVLSFYSYEKNTGNPSTRLKRLFNSGGVYSSLKRELFEIALDPSKHEEFLRKF